LPNPWKDPLHKPLHSIVVGFVTGCPSKLASLAVEAEQELDAAITRMDTFAYRKANRGTATDPKDAA